MFIDRIINYSINPMYYVYNRYIVTGTIKIRKVLLFFFYQAAERDACFIAEYFSTLSIKLQQLPVVITAASNVPPSSLGIP